MPMYEPKASALVNAAEAFRACVRRQEWRKAIEHARDIEELAEDFDRFRVDHKYLIDRWEERQPA